MRHVGFKPLRKREREREKQGEGGEGLSSVGVGTCGKCQVKMSIGGAMHEVLNRVRVCRRADGAQIGQNNVL